MVIGHGFWEYRGIERDVPQWMDHRGDIELGHWNYFVIGGFEQILSLSIVERKMKIEKIERSGGPYCFDASCRGVRVYGSCLCIVMRCGLSYLCFHPFSHRTVRSKFPRLDPPF